MKHLAAALVIVVTLAVIGCSPEYAEDADGAGFSAPTEMTRRMNDRVRETLPLDDQGDFEEARRGLIASAPHLQIKDADGAVIWDMPSGSIIAPMSLGTTPISRPG